MSRRAFVRGGLLGGLAAMGLTGVEIVRARYVHPYRPVLERIDLPLPDGAEGLDGLRIAFIADTHHGPFIDESDLQRAIGLLRNEEFELALFGGDYISESPRYAPAAGAALSAVMEMASIGGAAVLGNHDLTVSTSRVQDVIATMGIPVLRNDVTVFDYKGSQLAIAGIDETLLGEPHPHRTMQQVPEGVPALALWHEPEFAEMAAAEGAFAQLSGHTHGGQIRIPGIGPVGLPVHGKRHVIGTSNADGMTVYTTRGVGVYRPPVRVNCPPEVTLVTLRASSS